MSDTVNISLISGGFDPLHSGHMNYFKDARNYGDIVVLLNSDKWLNKKKGRPFMPWSERASIVKEIKGVISVLSFDDIQGNAIKGIQEALSYYPRPRYHVSWLNGGDRTEKTTPEVKWCQNNKVTCIFGVGGTKTQSSSCILQDWETLPVKRIWGEWRVLKDYSPHTKVKELLVLPKRRLSYQRHVKRNEYWQIVEGKATVFGDHEPFSIWTGESLNIPKGEWHQLVNLEEKPLRVVEIQWGELCDESDIERQET